MILEIKYVNFELSSNKYKSAYVSLPKRYDNCNDLIVERICKKVWQHQMLDRFNSKKEFCCFSAFNRDFRKFLEERLRIGENFHKFTNVFYSIKIYEEPICIPFITK